MNTLKGKAMTEYGLPNVQDNGHDIELVCGGELQSCKRCHGGESDLDTPCAERLASQLAQEKARADNAEVQRDNCARACVELQATINSFPAEFHRAKELEAVVADMKQIGWFDPGSKRFCYTDEKEHSHLGMPAYTIPVYRAAQAAQEPEAGAE